MTDLERIFDLDKIYNSTKAERWMNFFNQSGGIDDLKSPLMQDLLKLASCGFSENGLWKSWKFDDKSSLDFCTLSGLALIR